VTRSVLAGARWATPGLPLTRRSRARDGHPEDCTLGGAETRGRPRARVMKQCGPDLFRRLARLRQPMLYRQSHRRRITEKARRFVPKVNPTHPENVPAHAGAPPRNYQVTTRGWEIPLAGFPSDA